MFIDAVGRGSLLIGPQLLSKDTWLLLDVMIVVQIEPFIQVDEIISFVFCFFNLLIREF